MINVDVVQKWANDLNGWEIISVVKDRSHVDEELFYVVAKGGSAFADKGYPYSTHLFSYCNKEQRGAFFHGHYDMTMESAHRDLFDRLHY